MRVWREFRLVYPHAVSVLGLAAVIVVGCGVLESMAHRLSDPCPVPLERIHLATLVIAAAILGIARTKVHPAFNAGYLRWLRSTPWTYGTRLPLGPVLMSWQDIVVVGVLVALALPGHRLNPMWAPVAFVAGYSIVSLVPFLSDQLDLRLPMLFVIGFLANKAWPNPGLILGLALALLLVITLGLRSSLKRFHELPVHRMDSIVNGPMIVSEPNPERRLEVSKDVGTYYDLLDCSPPKGMSVSGKAFCIGIFGLIGYLAYLAHRSEEYREISAIGSAIVLTFILAFFALIRWAMYRGYPPISLWGRIKTGRLIVPRIDRVFIVPLLAVIGGLGSFWMLHGLGVPSRVGFGAAVFLGAVVAFLAGPTLGAHRLTGGHHFLIDRNGRMLLLGPRR